jgi:hypothetical protein
MTVTPVKSVIARPLPASVCPRAWRAGGGEHDDGGLGRRTDAVGAVEQPGRHEHCSERHDEPPAHRGRVARACPAEGPPPDRCGDGERPPAHDPRPDRPRRLLLATVEGDERRQAVHVDGARHACGDDDGDPRPVLADVVDGDAAARRGTNRRVDALVGRHRLQAADVPSAHVVVVGAVAVGPEQRRAVVRRQQHRPLELRQVVGDPGREQRRGRADHEQRSEPPTRAPGTAPPRQAGEADRQQPELAARQAREAHQHPEQRAARRGRVLVHVARHQQGERHEQARQRLGHHERVVDPQVRVDRGDPGGDEPDDRTGEAPPDEADHRDGDDAEQGHREALPGHVVAGAEAPRRQPQGCERAVLGPRQRREALAEPVALAVPPGLDAVVQRVVEQERVVELDDQEVAEAPQRADAGDQQQRTAEALVAVGHRHGRSVRPRR